MLKAFKVPRIRKAILFTIVIMAVYTLGRTLVIPGISSDYSAEGGSISAFTILSLLTGGSLETFSLFSLGVSPQITASIVVELLSNDVIKPLSDLKQEGPKGRKKLNKINQYFGFVLGLLQSYSMVRLFDLQYGILENNSITTYLYIMVVMASGSALLAWLGSQITSKGVGNGLSMIILFGILISFPSTIISAYSGITSLISNTTLAITLFVVYILILLFIMFAVVYMSTGVRKISVQYSGKKLSNGSQFTHLPIKPNSTSVLPLILANAVMSVPLVLVSYFNYPLYEKLTETIGLGTPWGTVLLAVLMLLLGMFYAFTVLNPEEIAKNLNKNGGYIPNQRPGKETVKYLSGVIKNTTLVGILGLMILVLIPYVMTLVFKLPASISFGGTSMILIVGIISDVVSNIEANLAAGKYTEWGLK
jgi:preprotein translocase subunit SecY